MPTTRYVPEAYPDFQTALLACSSGDTIVLDTSESMPLTGLSSALNTITVRAGVGKTPVLDHTLAPTYGLTFTGNNWTWTGIRFRSTVAGDGGYALFPDAVTGLTLTDCTFEGSPGCFAGDQAKVVQSCTFRNITGSISTTNTTSAFRACVFQRCDVSNALLGTTTTVDNCTFVQVRASFSVCNVQVIRGCIAQGCSADLATGVIFKASGVCANNNAFDCTASANFAGTTSGNTTVDPLFLDLATDLRVAWDSPMVGTGSSSSVATVTRSGVDFLSPKSKGAYETLRLAQTLGTFPDVYTAQIYVSGSQSVEDIEASYTWTTDTTGGVLNAVQAVGTFTPGGGEVPGEPIQLTMWPGVSPGVAYTITADSEGYGPSQYTLTPSSALAYPAEVPAYRNVAATQNAGGWELWRVAGVAETALAYDFGPSDTVAFVASTYGFSPVGAFYAAGLRFTYASKTDAAFHGVVSELPRVLALDAQTVVVWDERGFVPDAG